MVFFFLSLCLSLSPSFSHPWALHLPFIGLSALPSFLSHTYVQTPSVSICLPSSWTYGIVSDFILLGRWYEVFRGLEWRDSLRRSRHSTPVLSLRQQWLRIIGCILNLRADGLPVCVCEKAYLSVSWMSFFRDIYLMLYLSHEHTLLWCHEQHYLTGSWEAIHHLIKSVWKGSEA